MLILTLGAPRARALIEPLLYAPRASICLHFTGESEARRLEVISPLLDTWSPRLQVSASKSVTSEVQDHKGG